MPVAIITGSGTHSLPGFEHTEAIELSTPFGAASVSRGRFADVDVLHVSRHGAGHARLSNQATHRANIWALHDLGASAVVGCTACGAVDPMLELPFALVGFVTDYANEVVPGEPTPVAMLIELIGASSGVFSDLLTGAVPALEAERPSAAGTVYRFEQP